jgi:CubicO group peptidase (beta-lactamase class C family)
VADTDSRIQQVENGLIDETDTALPDPQRYTIAERMAVYHVPGVSVAVIHDGQLEWAKGYGLRALNQPGAVDTETLFQSGSISKPVAALAILRLVDSQNLDLDADVNDYLNSWRVPSVGGWQPRITLRHLLSHSAGTTVHGFIGYNHTEAVPTTLQILDGLKPANSDPVRVNTVPGTHFRYSGGGTIIAQLLACDVAGKPFQDIVREWVFEPLGMTRSTYEQPLQPQYHDNAARGHYYSGAPVEGGWYTMPELAAAGLWTTPLDIARFGIAVQRAYKGESSPISQQVARWMLTETVEGEDFNLGLGVFLRRPSSAAYFGHGGDNVGYKNNFKVYFEGSNSGAAVMANGDLAGAGLIEEILRSVARVYHWPEYVTESPSWFADSASIDHAPYLGKYRLKPGFTLTVSSTDGKLTLQPTGQSPLELRPISETKFVVLPLKTIVTFEREADRSVSALIFEQNGQEMTAKRIT